MSTFIATYIDDVNPESGDACFPLTAVIVRDEDGNILTADTWDEMYNLCIDEANFYINNSECAEERGYQIIDTDNGCAIIDNDEYRIVTYDIHMLNITLR